MNVSIFSWWCDPKGRPEFLMYPPCLESQCCHLIPLFSLLACYCPVVPSVLSVFCFWPILLPTFPEISFKLFFIERGFFLWPFYLFFSKQLQDDNYLLICSACCLVFYPVSCTFAGHEQSFEIVHRVEMVCVKNLMFSILRSLHFSYKFSLLSIILFTWFSSPCQHQRSAFWVAKCGKNKQNTDPNNLQISRIITKTKNKSGVIILDEINANIQKL